MGSGEAKSVWYKALHGSKASEWRRVVILGLVPLIMPGDPDSVGYGFSRGLGEKAAGWKGTSATWAVSDLT